MDWVDDDTLALHYIIPLVNKIAWLFLRGFSFQTDFVYGFHYLTLQLSVVIFLSIWLSVYILMFHLFMCFMKFFTCENFSLHIIEVITDSCLIPNSRSFSFEKIHTKKLDFFFNFLINRSPGNKAYLLQMDSGKIPVYCHMTSDGLGRCGGGGWTMVMKIDGTKV